MRKLPRFIKERYELANVYLDELGSIEGLRMPPSDDTVWQSYVITVDSKQGYVKRGRILRDVLEKKGIETTFGGYRNLMPDMNTVGFIRGLSNRFSGVKSTKALNKSSISSSGKSR